MTNTKWTTYTCTNRVDECDGVVSFYLMPADFSAPPAFLPGQCVTLRAEFDGIKAGPRDYTLTQSPGSAMLRISVKWRSIHEGDSKASDTGLTLYKQLKIGSTVELSEPHGEFTFNMKDEHPLVFICAGIGVAPIVSFLEALATENPLRKTHLLYSTKNSKTALFLDEIRLAMKGMPHAAKAVFFTAPLAEDHIGVDYDAQGRISAEKIRAFCQDPDADFWICGPASFMEMVKNALLDIGVIAPRIHTESFSGDSLKAKWSA